MPLPSAVGNGTYPGCREFLLFGIEQGTSQAATVDHYDFGIENFNADQVREQLSKLNLKFSDKTSKEYLSYYDPDGFQVQVNGPDYVGHVS